MLKRYDDCKGHCVCYADPETGLVEHEYRKVKTKSHIQVGDEYVIEKEGIVTVLKRISTKKIEVKSYRVNA